MIVQKFIELICGILDVIWVVEIPGLPESVQSAFDSFLSYISDRLNMVSFWIPAPVMTLISVLGGLLLAAYAVYEAYLLVMWILRKIPILGIK